MRTIYPIILVVAMAVAGLMFQMSGFNAVVGQDGHMDRVSDQVEDRANDSAAAQNESFEGSARSRGGGLVGFVISGVGAIMDIAALIVLFPLELESMGFPRWFAYPLGALTQIIVSIGVVQFASGRVWR